MLMIDPRSTPDVHPPHDDLTDARWLEAIASGDEESFCRLRERHAGWLYAAIFRILGDRSEAEEVLQEVFSAVWRRADQYHPERGRPVTWLAATARNRAIDRIRARRRRARLQEAYAAEAESIYRGRSPIAGPEAAARRDACAAVRSAVTGLTGIQREAIEKVYFEGLTQRAVAESIGEPLGTVKARVRRGLAKLREQLEA